MKPNLKNFLINSKLQIPLTGKNYEQIENYFAGKIQSIIDQDIDLKYIIDHADDINTKIEYYTKNISSYHKWKKLNDNKINLSSEDKVDFENKSKALIDYFHLKLEELDTVNTKLDITGLNEIVIEIKEILCALYSQSPQNVNYKFLLAHEEFSKFVNMYFNKKIIQYKLSSPVNKNI